jgi:hypothetical protein
MDKCKMSDERGVFRVGITSGRTTVNHGGRRSSQGFNQQKPGCGKVHAGWRV